MRQGHHALVHDSKPQPRQVGQHIHAEVAVRQCRQVVKMSKALVAPERMRVMIGMTLEMKQDEVAQDVVAGPGMVGLAALVAPPGILLSQEAVVLDVVGAG